MSELIVGKILGGRYKIIEVLGKGEFAETFLAEDTASQRTVVIKKLTPVTDHNIDWKTFQSFKEELDAEKVELLVQTGGNSSNSPDLYACFKEQDEFYSVQEYIEGKTLAEISPIPQEQAFSFYTYLLIALQYTLNNNLIHRDIKPENIMMLRSDELPVVVDFGEVENSKDSMEKACSSSESIIINYQNINWKRGNKILAFASGGAFLGGLIAQIPGSIIGAMMAAIYGSMVKEKRT
ncbi:MAG: protein kinase [Crocosphaera sp.]|nr:protein kinase [Crocosphaera sp.]